MINNIIENLGLTEESKELKADGIATVGQYLKNKKDETNASEKEKMLYSKVENALFSKFAVAPIQGTTLLEEYLRLTRILATDCQHVDDLLYGGIFTSEMTELFGPPSSGKTQFAMTLVSNVICKHELNVMYIDSNSCFESQRLQEIIASKTDINSPQEMKKILQKVKCLKTFDVFHLLSEIESIRSKLFSESDVFCLRLKVIVLDSISAIISPLLGGHQTHGHALMAKIGLLLKEIAYDYGISVLVINNAVMNFESANSRAVESRERFKPALGKSWSSVPQVRLYMDFTHEGVNDEKEKLNERMISIHKHPRLPTRSTTKVFITKSGISNTPQDVT